MTALRTTAVLPVFNGAPYVDGAIDSILAQTHKPDEIFIVDDGSTDESAEVIASIVARVKGIKVSVITQENAGQSSARNAAVGRASGELIAFLDQDDRWHPDHLAVLTQGFESDPTLGWAYSDFDEIDGDAKLITRQFLASYEIPQPKSDVAGYLAHDAMILPTASVVRRLALITVGGFDPRLTGYEDDDLFLRLFRDGWQCRFDPRSLAQFRVHSLSSSARASFGASREIYFDKVSADFPDDARMNRYYVSDMLLPRVLYGALSDYAVALRQHNDADARAIALSATRMARTAHVSARRRLGLAVIRHPRVCRILLAVLRGIPRALRPRVTPAFRLN
jgi:glycosyltransferase involved in cell wall biosynthesis